MLSFAHRVAPPARDQVELALLRRIVEVGADGHVDRALRRQGRHARELVQRHPGRQVLGANLDVGQVLAAEVVQGQLCKQVRKLTKLKFKKMDLYSAVRNGWDLNIWGCKTKTGSGMELKLLLCIM